MAVVREINLDEYAEQFGDGRGKSAKFLKTQRRLIYDSVYDACLASVKDMAERSPVDTGLYASAWDVRKVSKDEIQFGNTAPYATIVELGAQPFKPPYQPILEWTARQLQTTPDDPKAKRMAYFVIKKIEREGIDPKNVLENGLEDVILPLIKITIMKNKDKHKYLKDDV